MKHYTYLYAGPADLLGPVLASHGEIKGPVRSIGSDPIGFYCIKGISYCNSDKSLCCQHSFRCLFYMIYPAYQSYLPR